MEGHKVHPQYFRIHLPQCKSIEYYVPLLSTVLKPNLLLSWFRTEWWAEPDANSFRVRGKTYKQDSRKISESILLRTFYDWYVLDLTSSLFLADAGSSLFRLIAADIIETDVPILNGMCLHPTERVQLALAREQKAKLTGKPSDMPPFVFCVNISSEWCLNFNPVDPSPSIA